MTWLLHSLGAVLVLLALGDVFHTIFHPTESGFISDHIAKGIWRMFRFVSKNHQRLLSNAGPVAVVSILISWAAMIIVGCALIYLPHLAKGFTYSDSAATGQQHGFFTALNLSIDSMITLSAEAQPKAQWLRLVMGVEALAGFGILTASISWLLSIYPVLERRRALSERVVLMQRAEKRVADPMDLPDADTGQFLLELASLLISLRNDLLHYPVTFFFHEENDRHGLSGVFPYISALADEACNESRAKNVRVAGTILRGALDELMRVLAEYLGQPDRGPESTMRALAREHMRDPIKKAS